MLEGTSYSDSVTPAVTATYDAFGRPHVQTNGVATTTYAYDPATLVLDFETIDYDFDLDGTADFTRVLDREQDSLLRDSGFQLKTENSTLETSCCAH